MKEGAVTINLTPVPIILAILFVVLKLTDVIAWDWVWVFSPIWIGFAAWMTIALLVFAVTFFTLLIGAVFGLIGALFRRK